MPDVLALTLWRSARERAFVVQQLLRGALPGTGAVLAQNHVAGHAVEPRQRLVGDHVEAPPGHEERLGGDLVREIRAQPPMRECMHARVVRREDGREP
jgi:hypothetical protein